MPDEIGWLVVDHFWLVQNMQYEHFVPDFVGRTIKNLRLVRKQKRGTKDRYEITQLVNSLLGLIVIPYEHMRGDIPSYPLDSLKRQGWPLFKVQRDNTCCTNLRLLVENLRNGIAHGKMEFHGEDNITGITIKKNWDGKSWEGYISVGELRQFVDKLANEVIRVCHQQQRKSRADAG